MERNLVEEERRIKAVATDPLAALLTAIAFMQRTFQSIRNPV